MNRKVYITTDNSNLNIKINHYGLKGKFKGGTLKLIYILLGVHGFNYILFFSSNNLFFNLFSFIFSVWEFCFVCLIVYSCFGFTKVSIDRKNFKIEKGIGKIIKEVSEKTANIEKIEVKPVEVFGGQYKNSLFGFSSEKNASYACYLLSNPEYCFGAMCDRQDLEQLVLQINDYLSDRSIPLYPKP